MRKELLSVLGGAAFAAATSIGLLALAAPASAQQPVREMNLGATTAAPPGFLEFCARTPAQCGLEGAVDAQGRPLTPAALRQMLFARYYWASAFGFSVPSAGTAPAPLAQRTGWNAVVTGAPIASAAAEAVSDADAKAGRLVSLAIATQFFATLDQAGLLTPDTPAGLAAPALSASDRAGMAIAISNAFVRPMTVAAPSVRAQAAAVVAPHAELAGAWAAEAPAYAVAAPARSASSLARAAADRAAAEAAETPAYAAQDRGAPAAAPTVAARPAFDTPAYAQSPAMLAMTGALMAELDQVNQGVNHAIRYVSDRTLYGDEDHWHLSLDPGGPRAGDCKDYVLEKRRALIDDGVPASSLAIAIVQTPWRESHAVLLVDTDQGELVLDSLSSWIQPWWKVNYHWVERQTPGQQLSWVTIS
jgi:predicted transglutaminase-like cysteine proteinase